MSNPEIVLASIEIAAILCAAVAIGLGSRQVKRTHDLQVALELSASFRERWEAGWDASLDAMETGNGEISADLGRSLRHMLNWIDWVGTLLRTRSLHNDRVIFYSLSAPFARILGAGRTILESDVEAHGPGYWASLLPVARRLQITWLTDLLERSSPTSVKE